MGLFGLSGASPVAPDDSRLPRPLVKAMGKGGRFLIFEVWTAGGKVATVPPNTGSDGSIILVSGPRRGTFRQVAILLGSFALPTPGVGGGMRFNLRDLFAMPLEVVCSVVHRAAQDTSLVWSEYVSLSSMHGEMSPSKKLLETVAEDERCQKTAPPSVSGVFPGPNCLAKMRGTELSAPVRCIQLRTNRWVIRFRRIGDFVLLCRALPNEPNPLVELEMNMDEFVARCTRSGIYRQLWAKRMRHARLVLSELIEEARAGGKGDPASKFILSLHAAAQDSSNEIFTFLDPPPCLKLDVPTADYEKAFKFDQRWFINRVCSGLVACGQRQLAQAILERIRSKGWDWVNQAPRRRASEDKHKGRMGEMGTWRGKTNPSCSSCTISCPTKCAYPLNLETFTNVGPVEIIVGLAEAAAAEERAVDALMADLEE